MKAGEILQLAQLGVPPDALKFRNVSIESEKVIVVRDEATSEIKIVDLATKMTTKIPNAGNAIDGAIMHPTSKVIGLRGTCMCVCVCVCVCACVRACGEPVEGGGNAIPLSC